MYSHGSFNRVYRLVWSALHETWVVASELAGGRGKSSSTPLLSAALLASLVSISGGAGAAPQGGQVVGGSGSISTSGATTTINQASDKLSLNWQSFNVGKTESVNFVQPSTSAIAVNRILDTQGSQILGKINANGQVWLINPNGVLFGNDAQINVGGLVASTLNPDDASIGSARSNFSGNSTAGVVNFGQINAAQGGYVALLGHSVSNQGSISAPGGTVALGAGSAVSLNFAGSKLLGLEVTSNQVNALAENGGLIQADGGQVLLSAGARDSLLASVVNNTGVIQARTVQEQDGKIVLLGGMATGTTHVGGTLDASAPNGGNGGFIETSAYTVNVDDSASITTASGQGTQGQWLIDPFDFYVKSSGGNITGAALGTALGNNNVTIQTVAAANPTVTGATASGSYPNGLGDIYVNDAVSWSANYTLTLNAYNSIYINSAITATGTSGKLALQYSQGTSTGSYNVNAPVSLKAAVATDSSGNFSTKLGSAATTYYTVITSLGSAGDEGQAGATNSLQGLGHSSRLGGNYVLGADIAAGGTSTWNANSGFSPIGDITTLFTGTLDGLGHTISGLTISRTSTNLVGLFGYTSTASVIKNVGLTSGSVTGQNYVGSLAGFSQGTISNSYATGTVSGTSNMGGLVGALETGTITSSYATGGVSGATAGGLVGLQNSGTISASYASGAVSGTLYTGGLVGNAKGTITSSYATGTVSGSATYSGGLVGALFTPGSISSSYATGAVTGTGYTGGLAGLNSGTVSSSYATNTVNSSQYSGGLVGLNSGTLSADHASGTVSGAIAGGLVASNTGKIGTSYATGVVTGTSYAGGLAGQGTGTISSSYATGAVNGSGSYTGGLIGNVFTGGSVSSSYATGAVTASGTYSGGLAGSNAGTIASSYATGAVSSSAQAGGLVGANSGTLSSDYATGTVSGSIVGGLVAGQVAGGATSSSYATGAVTGISYAGGLMGTNAGTVSTSYASGAVGGSGPTGGLLGALFNSGTISNSYATGAVSSGTDRGGLIGRITATGYSVSNTYATGAVSSSGATYSGGLVGIVTNASTGSVSSSFWNSDKTSSTGYGSAGTGLSSTAMKTASNFSAWSISSSGSSSTWFVYDGYTNPLLRTFLTPLSVTYTVSGSKTYDGTTACGTITCTYTTGTLTSGKNLLGTSSLALSSKNAGTVTGTGTGLYSDQQGYVITASTAGTATINKAELTYTANTASFRAGTPPSGLSGTLSGFVNLETQGTATTGMLAWVTQATSASGAGRYAINGSGLLADNYRLSQAEGNSAALTLTQNTSFVPVVSATPLPSNTSFEKKARVALPNNKFTDLTDIEPLVESELLYVQGNGINLPKGFNQAMPTNLDQKP